MAVEYYRTTDPTENLGLTVYLREIREGDGSNYRKPKTIQTTLTWQQKLFSPTEITDYLQSHIHPRGTAIQMETRGALSRLERSGCDIKGLLSQDPLLYTLIDRDHFSADESLLHGGGDGLSAHPWMGAVSQRLSHDRHRLTRSMHLLLATDNQPDRYDQSQFTSHHLLSVSVTPQQTAGDHSSFIVAVQGLLSRPAIESSSQLSASSSKQAAALSLFLDESSAAAALSKGFLLTSQRVRSATGRAFEVAVLCDRDVLSPLALADISRQSMINDSVNAAVHRPAANPSTSHANGDSYSNNSSSDSSKAPKLLYRMAVDGCWDHHNSSVGQGIQLMVAAACPSSHSSKDDGWRVSGDGMVNLVNLHDNSDNHDNNDSQSIQWMSPTAMPSSFSLSRPSFLSSLSRLITAAVFMLFSIAAVAVGDSVALWLFPVIALVVAAFIDFTDDDVISSGSNSGERLSKEATVLPLSMAMAMTLLPPASTTADNDGDATKEEKKSKDGNDSQPRLSIPSVGPSLQLWLFSPLSVNNNSGNSSDNNNQGEGVELTIAKAMSLLGEASCPLPVSPGPFTIDLQLTRPMRGIREELAVLFLGRPPQLKPVTSNSHSNSKGRLLGSASMAAGWVRISGHVTAVRCGLRQQKKTKDPAAAMTADTPASSLPRRMTSSADGLGARERVAALLGGRNLSRSTSSAAASPSNGPRPSVKAILESLNLRSRPPSVALAAAVTSPSLSSSSAASAAAVDNTEPQSVVSVNASANAVAGSAAALLRAGRNKSKKAPPSASSSSLPPTMELSEGGEATATATATATETSLGLTGQRSLLRENSSRRPHRYDGDEETGETDSLLGGRIDAADGDGDGKDSKESETQPLLDSDK